MAEDDNEMLRKASSHPWHLAAIATLWSNSTVLRCDCYMPPREEHHLSSWDYLMLESLFALAYCKWNSGLNKQMTAVACLNRREDVIYRQDSQLNQLTRQQALMLIMTKWESCSFNTDLEIYELEAGWLHSKVINEWEKWAICLSLVEYPCHFQDGIAIRLSPEIYPLTPKGSAKSRRLRSINSRAGTTMPNHVPISQGC